MKKYEFTYPFNKEETIKRILENTQNPKLFSYDKVIFGKVSRNHERIILYHGISYRNSFLPILELELTEKGDNKTVAQGFWRWSLYTVIVMAVIITLMLIHLLGGILLRNNTQIVTMIGFALFYAFLCWFGTWLERKNMKRIIEHLEKQASN